MAAVDIFKTFPDMYDKLTDTLASQFLILAAAYTLVFLIVLLDLWSGIRKARRRGEFRSSYGLRKTVSKVAGYFNMMMALTLIDVMLITAVVHLAPQISFRIPVIPVLSLAGAVFAGIIEFKSIYEKAGDKDKGKFQDAAKLAGRLASDRNVRNVLNELAGYLSSQKNDGDDDNKR